MKILKTNIPDFVESIENEKIHLADKVVSAILPMMDYDYQEKLRKAKSVKESVSKKKKQLNIEKEELELILKEYNIKKKVKLLLERIMKLLGSGLLIDEFKKEMLVVLNVIEDLTEDKLDFYLNETIRVFNKKIN